MHRLLDHSDTAVSCRCHGTSSSTKFSAEFDLPNLLAWRELQGVHRSKQLRCLDILRLDRPSVETFAPSRPVKKWGSSWSLLGLSSAAVSMPEEFDFCRNTDESRLDCSVLLLHSSCHCFVGLTREPERKNFPKFFQAPPGNSWHDVSCRYGFSK